MADLKESADNKQKNPSWKRLAAWAVGVVSSLWLIYWGFISWFITCGKDNWATRGQFGDMFGALNTFFTGMAMAGAGIAVWYQHKQLEMAIQEKNEKARQLEIQKADAIKEKEKQAKELAEQKRIEEEEKKKQAEELAKQKRIAHLQQFETTFFNMMHMLAEVEKGTVFETSSTGKKAFKDFAKQTTTLGVILGDYLKTLDMKDYAVYWCDTFRKKNHQNIDDPQNAISDFFNKNNAVIGPYFRTVYTILKFVDNSPLCPDKEKKSYTNILRSQLSDDQLKLLYFNCLWRFDKYAPFRKLVENYTILKNINPYEMRKYAVTLYFVDQIKKHVQTYKEQKEAEAKKDTEEKEAKANYYKKIEVLEFSLKNNEIDQEQYDTNFQQLKEKLSTALAGVKDNFEKERDASLNVLKQNISWWFEKYQADLKIAESDFENPKWLRLCAFKKPETVSPDTPATT